MLLKLKRQSEKSLMNKEPNSSIKKQPTTSSQSPLHIKMPVSSDQRSVSRINEDSEYSSIDGDGDETETI